MLQEALNKLKTQGLIGFDYIVFGMKAKKVEISMLTRYPRRERHRDHLIRQTNILLCNGCEIKKHGCSGIVYDEQTLTIGAKVYRGDDFEGADFYNWKRYLETASCEARPNQMHGG